MVTLLNYFDLQSFESRRRTDHMVVGFTTTCVINTYYPLTCELAMSDNRTNLS